MSSVREPSETQFFYEVQLVFPLQREAVHQRPRVLEPAGGEGGYRLRGAFQPLVETLTADKIDALLRKWLKRLPHPFAAKDRLAGYRYQGSILQAEFSLTQVLDRPPPCQDRCRLTELSF